MNFKSKYSHHDAFYAHGNLLRAQFGQWDCLDPVADAILDLVEAQNELADLFDDGATYGIGSEAAFKATVEKRHAAGERLMKALNDRSSWPDPTLGRG
jgi:hypothetical protein